MSSDFEVQASLSAAIGGLSGAISREERWRQRIAGAISQVPFAGSISLAGGAGTYDAADQLQAKAGYCWSIRRITAQGFSAGTVTVYRNSTAGEPIMPFPVAAVNTIGRGELMLMPTDRMIWQATGITGIVNFWGVADCFESWFLPYYIS